jgi:hypothetical protein
MFRDGSLGRGLFLLEGAKLLKRLSIGMSIRAFIKKLDSWGWLCPCSLPLSSVPEHVSILIWYISWWVLESKASGFIILIWYLPFPPFLSMLASLFGTYLGGFWKAKLLALSSLFGTYISFAYT